MRVRLDALGARWPRFGAVLAVHTRVDELGGGFVAGAVTLSLFLSLFPLLLVATAVLGFVSSGDAGFAADVVDTLGLSGAAAETVTEALASAEEQRATASIIGFVGALWSALGVVGAIGHAVDRAWPTSPARSSAASGSRCSPWSGPSTCPERWHRHPRSTARSAWCSPSSPGCSSSGTSSCTAPR
ncbi:MAG: YihY/virulence factor BrkB family protein [Acidimicrobiia bacterium]|nr:YihY/virulence factor BrkB family protein [Acidimicrobiia bacterium]